MPVIECDNCRETVQDAILSRYLKRASEGDSLYCDTCGHKLSTRFDEGSSWKLDSPEAKLAKAVTSTGRTKKVISQAATLYNRD